MTTRALIAAFLFCSASVAGAQQPNATAARRVTLDQAVALALEHNHVVRIAGFSVEEKEQAKSVARSAYFPTVRNDTFATRLTDTQLVEIPTGGLGVVGSALMPPQNLIINQGAVNAVTTGMGVVQPLTQLWKIRAANDVARAEVNATTAKKRGIEDSVALKV